VPDVTLPHLKGKAPNRRKHKNTQQQKPGGLRLAMLALGNDSTPAL